MHKLPLTTKIHHWAVTAWLLWVMTIDFGESPIAQKLMFYGFWSTLAFPVNGETQPQGATRSHIARATSQPCRPVP